VKLYATDAESPVIVAAFSLVGTAGAPDRRTSYVTALVSSVEAVHASDTLLAVLPVTVTSFGTDGGVVSGFGDAVGLGRGLGDGPDPPAQLTPFSVQFDGSPEPDPMNPNDTDAPGATDPFQLRFVNV
jgi:hypothetical protein